VVSIRGGAVRWLAASAVILLVVTCSGTPPQGTALAWQLAAIHADPQRTQGVGAGTVIAFIDSGFDATGLPTFEARHMPEVSEVGGSVGDGDVNGHGTEMAVIAAGGGDRGVWGVAPRAEILPVVVTDAFGHASPHAVALGIAWAWRHGATVINLSLAARVANAEVADAIDAAIKGGSLVVAAAGDTGEPGPDFPASVPGVIAVYGQDRSGGIGAHSNSPVTGGVLAPGEGIESLEPIQDGVRPLPVNGTSAAAALVSGLLAACISAVGSHAGRAESPGARCERLLYQPTGRFLDFRHILEVVK
jgi:subtilisin